MRRDPAIFLIGEDIAGGTGGEGEDDAWGGVMGVTKGLLGEFGANRVIDTPISETAYIGAAIGAAVTGMRPVAELMFCDFAGVCFDQIMNQAAKLRYMLGGQVKGVCRWLFACSVAVDLMPRLNTARHCTVCLPIYLALRW